MASCCQLLHGCNSVNALRSSLTLLANSPGGSALLRHTGLVTRTARGAPPHAGSNSSTTTTTSSSSSGGVTLLPGLASTNHEPEAPADWDPASCAPPLATLKAQRSTGKRVPPNVKVTPLSSDSAAAGDLAPADFITGGSTPKLDEATAAAAVADAGATAAADKAAPTESSSESALGSASAQRPSFGTLQGPGTLRGANGRAQGARGRCAARRARQDEQEDDPSENHRKQMAGLIPRANVVERPEGPPEWKREVVAPEAVLRAEPLPRGARRIRPNKPVTQAQAGQETRPAVRERVEEEEGRGAGAGPRGSEETVQQEPVAARTLRPRTRGGLKARVSESRGGGAEVSEGLSSGGGGSGGRLVGAEGARMLRPRQHLKRLPKQKQQDEQGQGLQQQQQQQQQQREQTPSVKQQQTQRQQRFQQQGQQGLRGEDVAAVLEERGQGRGSRFRVPAALRRAAEEGAAQAKAATQRQARAHGLNDPHVRRDATAEQQRRVKRANELFADYVAGLADRFGSALTGRFGASAAAAAASASSDRRGAVGAASWGSGSDGSQDDGARGPVRSLGWAKRKRKREEEEEEERELEQRPDPPISRGQRLVMRKEHRARVELELREREQGQKWDAPVQAGKRPQGQGRLSPLKQQELEQQRRRKEREQRERERERQEEERERERRERERQQADLLHGLAQMFRNFARQTQPATAASALVAAVSPATAVAAAAAVGPWTDSGGGPGAAGPNPRPFSFLGRRANDVNLILMPVASKVDQPAAEAGAVDGGEQRDADGDGGRADGDGDRDGDARGPDPGAAGGASEGLQLRGRNPPTRADMLRLLKPVPRARLPIALRRIGERSDTPVVLPLSSESAARAGLQISGRAFWPAVQRMRRRRMYYYRVLQGGVARARELLQAQNAKEQLAGQAAEQAQDQWSGPMAREEQGGALQQGHGQASGGGGTEAAAAAARRRYALSGRSYRVMERPQYSDRLKRIVRKAGRRSLGAVRGVAATAAGTAALAPGAAAASGPAALTAAVADADDEGDGTAEEVQTADEEMEEDARGEYNPAAEVVNDAYEQVMGVRLPERAMYGKRAAALAAMSPQDVKAQCRAWTEACGKEYALAFHAREPFLLLRPAQTLLLSLEHLSKVFGLNPEECVQLALRSPSMVGLPYEQLQGTVEAVSEALEIGLKEASKIVMRYPVLAVRQPTSPVAGRVELVGALLPVNRDKLRQVLRQRPALLCRSPQHLATFMMNVSSRLNVPLFDVALMIAGSPGITGVNVARLVSRWAALQRVTSEQAAWREQLASMPPPSLARCLVAKDTAIERLQVVLERGRASEPDFLRFKRVLTMSDVRFDSLLEAQPQRSEGRDGHGSSAAIGTSTAAAAASTNTAADSTATSSTATATTASTDSTAAATAAASTATVAAAAPASIATTAAIAAGTNVDTTHATATATATGVAVVHSNGGAAVAPSQVAPQLARAGV